MLDVENMSKLWKLLRRLEKNGNVNIVRVFVVVRGDPRVIGGIARSRARVIKVEGAGLWIKP